MEWPRRQRDVRRPCARLDVSPQPPSRRAALVVVGLLWPTSARAQKPLSTDYADVTPRGWSSLLAAADQRHEDGAPRKTIKNIYMRGASNFVEFLKTARP